MQERKRTGVKLHTLIPLGDFKAILGIDDRDDNLSRFCLTTATYTIEQYCHRRLLGKRHFEWIEYCPASLDLGDLLLPLKEYPVKEVIGVYPISKEQSNLQFGTKGKEEILEPDFYRVIPECGSEEDWPYAISLSPAIKHLLNIEALHIFYWAGYSVGKAPPDLASACLELATWNMNRYRSRRIGMTGNLRGNGEHFELSMPANVCQLLEPYRRKMI